MTNFETNVLRFMQNNLENFGWDDTWCVTKSLPDGTVVCNNLTTLKALEEAGLSESRNQLESMRFRFPQLWKECNDVRKEVLKTGETRSFLSKFKDASENWNTNTDVIVVYQLWHWDDKYSQHAALHPEGMYLEAWNKYIKTKCDLIVCHWRLL